MAAKFGAVATAKLLLKITAKHQSTTSDDGACTRDRAFLGKERSINPLLNTNATADIAMRVTGKVVSTPLECAIFYAQPDMVQLLIEAGAAAEGEDWADQPPLHLALPPMRSTMRSTMRGKHLGTRRFATIRILLDAGVSVGARDGGGSTALHMAASTGSDLLVEVLLQAGASPNIKNHEGATPLHNSAKWSSTAVVSMLLQAGAVASPEAKDNSGNTPLLLAAKNGGGRYSPGSP